MESNQSTNLLKVEIGERFRQFRQKISKSQLEVANAIGKSNSWLSSVANGEHHLLIHDLVLLWQYYGVSTSYFLDSQSNVFTNNQVGITDPIELTEMFFRKMNSILPVRVPVYLQSQYTLDSIDEPIDYIYWSRQKTQSREVIIVQAQTNNMCKNKISPIAKNDRVIFQINTPMRTGIGAIMSFRRKNFEDTNGLSIVEILKENDSWFYNNQALKEPIPLDPNQYIGMAIQCIKTYPFEKHNPTWLKYDSDAVDIAQKSIAPDDVLLWSNYPDKKTLRMKK